MKVCFVYSNYLRDLLPAPPIGPGHVASATADAGHQVERVGLLFGPANLTMLARASFKSPMVKPESANAPVLEAMRKGFSR